MKKNEVELLKRLFEEEEERRRQDFENAQGGVRPGRKYADARGVPCVGGGSSAIPGTDPLAALIAKENRGQLDLTPLEPIPRPEPAEPRVRHKKLGRRVLPEGKYF